MVRHRAFTLVELLVAIGILAVLMAILLPVISRARRSADRASCASNLRQIGALLHLYANDNGGEIPAVMGPVVMNPYVVPPDPSIPLGPTSWISFGVNWYRARDGVALLVDPPIGQARQTYVTGAQIFRCPGDNEIAPNRLRDDDFGYPSQWWDADDMGRDTGYGDGARAMSFFYLYVPRDGAGYEEVTPTLRVLTPGKYDGYQRHNVAQRGAASKAVFADAHPLLDELPATWGDGFHGQGWNVLYLDGHVIWIGTADVQADLETLITRGVPHLTARLTVWDRHGG